MNIDIQSAAQIVKQGGLVAFPTETVYGLGANALNNKAVAKIYEAKKRPFFDPLIVHISSKEALSELVSEVPSVAQDLIYHFWPGSLTIIFKKKSIVPDLVTAGFSTVAIRMPNHPIALDLISKSECPIAAPSANPFGRLSPTQADHVRKYLSKNVDMILDGGKCQMGLESTIIDVTQKVATIQRLGAITIEEIEEVIGKVASKSHDNNQILPGALKQHYAPHTKMILLTENEPYPKPQEGYGYLTFGKREDYLRSAEWIESLSNEGNILEAAANLFEVLHKLDERNLKVIYTKKVPNVGLGVAINDRLIKASNTFKP